MALGQCARYRLFTRDRLLHLEPLVTLFTIPALFMALTDFAICSEADGLGGWRDRLFWWVIPSLGGSQEAYLRHRLRMWVLGYFTLVHVYVAIREDIMSRQAVLPTMITGHRTIRDCRA
jgi:Ni/Fe-hydrogenase 1 B-type cytochrome subunit